MVSCFSRTDTAGYAFWCFSLCSDSFFFFFSLESKLKLSCGVGGMAHEPDADALCKFPILPRRRFGGSCKTSSPTATRYSSVGYGSAARCSVHVPSPPGSLLGSECIPCAQRTCQRLGHLSATWCGFSLNQRRKCSSSLNSFLFQVANTNEDLFWVTFKKWLLLFLS